MDTPAITTTRRRAIETTASVLFALIGVSLP
jgi:hypothetical protein